MLVLNALAIDRKSLARRAWSRAGYSAAVDRQTGARDVRRLVGEQEDNRHRGPGPGRGHHCLHHGAGHGAGSGTGKLEAATDIFGCPTREARFARVWVTQPKA